MVDQPPSQGKTDGLRHCGFVRHALELAVQVERTQLVIDGPAGVIVVMVQAECEPFRFAPDRGLTMIHRVPPPPPSALAYIAAWLNPSTYGRWSSGLVLAGLLLAACAVAGASSLAIASDQKSSSKAEAAKTQAANGGSGPVSADGLVQDPALRQRQLASRDPALRQHYRQAIAQMLEGSKDYRTIFEDGAVKLIDAKISHGFLVIKRGNVPVDNQTEYCASAKVDFPLLPPIPRTALVTITKADNGSENFHAEIGLNYTPRTCLRVKYDPFPELEQARARRRKALGKAD
jgi:hypothetical protein